jgi:hypothetical protein
MNERKKGGNMTTDELRERKELTDAIVANLKVIEESGFDLNDLEEMRKSSGAVVVNLQAIEERELLNDCTQLDRRRQ